MDQSAESKPTDDHAREAARPSADGGGETGAASARRESRQVEIVDHRAKTKPGSAGLCEQLQLSASLFSTPEGLEHPADFARKTPSAGESGAESGAVGARQAQFAPDLAKVVAAWPGLSAEHRAAVVDIVMRSVADANG